MSDKGALFCAYCGTVSTVDGNCPQCSKPLKKLGRVGSITESKRATQQMIDKTTLGLALDLQGLKRTTDPDSSASAFLTLYRPQTPSASPRNKTNSPMPSPRIQAPMLISPRLIAQPQQPSPHSSPTLARREVSVPQAPESPPLFSPPPERVEQQTSEVASTDRRSYFTATMSRLSQVFSWKNKTPEQKPNSDESTATATLGSSSSVPDFTALTTSSSSNGIRVLPPLSDVKILRRRSSVDGGASRSQSTPYISAKMNETSNRPTLTISTPSDTSKYPNPSINRDELKAPTALGSTPYLSSTTVPSTTPVVNDPSNVATSIPTAINIPVLAAPPPAMALSPPIQATKPIVTPLVLPNLVDTTPIPTITSPTPIPITTTPTPTPTPLPTSVLTSIPTSTQTTSTPTPKPTSTTSTPISIPATPSTSTPTPTTSTTSTPISIPTTPSTSLTLSTPSTPATPPTSTLNPESPPESPIINSPRSQRPARPSKPKLKIIVNTDSDSSSDERVIKSTKSALNIFAKVEGVSSLPHPLQIKQIQKNRPLPSPPVLIPSNPFSTSPGAEPLVSPRAHHTPPKRPLPALPTPKTESPHPTILRRNTVHADMHVVRTPDGTKVNLDWLPLPLSGRNSRPSTPKADAVPITPKGEVTLLPPSPKIEYYHPHIQPPPKGLASDEMREKIALELITTEYEYVNDLYTLVCAKNEMERFISKNELSSLFNNVEQIYKVNEAIYRKLLGYCANSQKRRLDASANGADELPSCSVDDKVESISRTFLGLAHTMKIYVKYSLNHQRALEKLKMLTEADEYSALLKGVEAMPGFKAESIAGYLIKPVQRICRYPLLIKEIVKSTTAGHHTLAELQEALECVEQTLVEINEAQRSIERELNLMRAQQDLRLFGMDIDVMSPTRSLVLDGEIRLVPVIRKTSGSRVIKKPKQGHYFLFDDFFLFVMNTKKKETPHIFIPADQSLVTDPGENALEIIHAGQQIWMFVLPSYHAKVFLMQKLNQIIEDNLQEARLRNGGDKSGKSTLNIATLRGSGKDKKKKRGLRDLGDIFGEK